MRADGPTEIRRDRGKSNYWLTCPMVPRSSSFDVLIPARRERFDFSHRPLRPPEKACGHHGRLPASVRMLVYSTQKRVRPVIRAKKGVPRKCIRARPGPAAGAGGVGAPPGGQTPLLRTARPLPGAFTKRAHPSGRPSCVEGGLRCPRPLPRWPRWPRLPPRPLSKKAVFP